MVECRGWKQNLNKQSAVHHVELPARLTTGSSRSDIQPPAGRRPGHLQSWGDAPGGTPRWAWGAESHPALAASLGGLWDSNPVKTSPGFISSYCSFTISQFLNAGHKAPKLWHRAGGICVCPQRPTHTTMPCSPRRNGQLFAFSSNITLSPSLHTSLVPAATRRAQGLNWANVLNLSYSSAHRYRKYASPPRGTKEVPAAGTGEQGRAVRDKAQCAGVKLPRSSEERGRCLLCIPGEAVPATSITPRQQQRGGEAMACLAGWSALHDGRNHSQSRFAKNAGPEGP